MRARAQRAVLMLAALALVGGMSTGCLGFSLSEEAKPRTSEEHFLVAVQEYRLLADQATEWLAGVTTAAQAGDTSAAQYRETALKIAEALDIGEAAIRVGAQAIVNADGEGLEKQANILENVTQTLAALAFATAGS